MIIDKHTLLYFSRKLLHVKKIKQVRPGPNVALFMHRTEYLFRSTRIIMFGSVIHTSNYSCTEVNIRQEETSKFSSFTFFRTKTLFNGSTDICDIYLASASLCYLINRDLKHRQRKGTTTTSGSKIFPRKGSAHVRCCRNVV